MGWGRDVYSTRTEGRRAIERSYILPRPSEAPLAFLSTPAGGGATGGKAAAACKKRRRSMQPKAAQAFAVDSTSPVFSSTQQMVRISRHAVVAPPLGRWPRRRQPACHRRGRQGGSDGIHGVYGGGPTATDTRLILLHAPGRAPGESGIRSHGHWERVHPLEWNRKLVFAFLSAPVDRTLHALKGEPLDRAGDGFQKSDVTTSLLAYIPHEHASSAAWSIRHTVATAL